MSQQQGPIIVVSDGRPPAFMVALGQTTFPVIETTWAEASRAVAQLHPAIVIAEASQSAAVEPDALARQIGDIKPYVPFLVVGHGGELPENAIPFSKGNGGWERLVPRLRAALRVRTLHATVLRRLDDQSVVELDIARINPARDATVLLVGRGGGYPALSVALGERVGVVGALSIEAAAKHLNSRDIDGIVLGEGFTDRVIDAFLTVLSEDPRFRNLPILVTLPGFVPSHDLPNLEIVSGDSAHIATNALPQIRQHVLEAYLSRTLRSIDAGGLLDPVTGLLTTEAFDRDLAVAIDQTLANGGGLSVARFAFDPLNARARFDGARLLSRLMRQMDFGTLRDDGSALVVFAETDLRTAHVIARRLLSVMRHTSHDRRDGRRSEPAVSVATLMPPDTMQSLLARLDDEGRRAAS